MFSANVRKVVFSLIGIFAISLVAEIALIFLVVSGFVNVAFLQSNWFLIVDAIVINVLGIIIGLIWEKSTRARYLAKIESTAAPSERTKKIYKTVLIIAIIIGVFYILSNIWAAYELFALHIVFTIPPATHTGFYIGLVRYIILALVFVWLYSEPEPKDTSPILNIKQGLLLGIIYFFIMAIFSIFSLATFKVAAGTTSIQVSGSAATGNNPISQSSGDNELSSSTAPIAIMPASGPAPLPIIASVICRASSAVNQDITVVNWGDQTQETCVGTPTSSVIKAIEHIYRTAGTYRASINDPGSSQVSVVVTNDGQSVMPKITSPNTGAVFVIGSMVPLSWEGIDGINENLTSGTRDYVAASLSDDLATPRGVMGNNDTYLVIPDTDSYQWNTAGISPGEYTFEMGGPGSDEPYIIDPVWFIPPDSSDITPTVNSIEQQPCSNIPTSNGKFIYNLTVGGTGFTPASYAYVSGLSINESFGSMIPTNVSPDGTALTISSDMFVLNGVYAVKIYNGAHGSNINETITISCPAS